MACYQYDNFVFTALDDFTRYDDPDQKLKSAQEFGIKIIDRSNLAFDDWRVISGPFWRFRCRAQALFNGYDGKCSFFIRRVEVTKNSSTKLYYHDLKTGKDAIIELRRRPGLALTFRSGKHHTFRLDVNLVHTHDNHIYLLSNGDRFDVE